jgi:hypothetical protein
MKESILPFSAGEEKRKVYLGCDAHRKYSVFVAMNENGKIEPPVRVEHDRQKFRMFAQIAAWQRSCSRGDWKLVLVGG